MGYGLGYGLDYGLGYGLGFGLGFGLVYGPVQGLNYDWLGFIVACISQVFKGSIASLKCSCFLGDKTSHAVLKQMGNVTMYSRKSLQLLWQHQGDIHSNYPEENILQRLWPLQEIILSDTVQFVRGIEPMTTATERVILPPYSTID